MLLLPLLPSSQKLIFLLFISSQPPFLSFIYPKMRARPYRRERVQQRSFGHLLFPPLAVFVFNSLIKNNNNIQPFFFASNFLVFFRHSLVLHGPCRFSRFLVLLLFFTVAVRKSKKGPRIFEQSFSHTCDSLPRYKVRAQTFGNMCVATLSYIYRLFQTWASPLLPMGLMNIQDENIRDYL
jgi:hypothetical protein